MGIQIAEDLMHARLPRDAENGLVVRLACSEWETNAFFTLRHRVFARELGARLTAVGEMDQEPIDEFCQHLIVIRPETGEVVAGTRILTDTQAAIAGGFYTAGEFILDGLLDGGGRSMEIGRTCVAPGHRRGEAFSLLWHGLARFVEIHRIRRIIGCASVPVGDQPAGIWPLFDSLVAAGRVEDDRPVRPLRPVPRHPAAPAARLPALLGAYLRLGARILGEPCWDPVFRVADLPMALDPDRLERRFLRRVLRRNPPT